MKMPTAIVFSVLLIASVSAQTRSKAKPAAQRPTISIQTATTKDGRTVLLKSDGTWEYTNDPVIAAKPVNSSALAAIKALRLMAGATEVGINFEEYGRRLIDLKASVDEAQATLADGEMKSEIELSMDAYGEAGQAWNSLVRRGGTRYSEPFLSPDSDPAANKLQIKYGIPTETVDPREGMSVELLRTLRPGDEKAFRIMKQTPTLTQIWAAARKHLEKAESLAK